ncbi:serine threonine-protein kinase [Ophiostoma piceae UAMH 11346]|uniref:non-specific serine/threonine protein kinase n=1 Tax=Ophiostoma piceae (strain UAMH 11346) TaxID=1262450 RepID=S3CDE4_OPHP1|nr:serine threonine-protein kinase [Ophiostoma piceae UAMH 11346]
MAPTVTSWDNLAFAYEETDDDTGQHRQTIFAVVDDDDVAYFGTSNLSKKYLSFDTVTSLLEPVPDEDVYPQWTTDENEGNEGNDLTRARETDTPPSAVYIKRPMLAQYAVFKKHNVLPLIPNALLEEAQTMEFLTQHPHPHIVRYHGCRVRRGRIVGLVLDRYPHTLTAYLQDKVGTVDKEPFMDALQSALHHLHALGWAHNDLNPSNILVDPRGLPVLIDFGSAQPVGNKLGTSRGTDGWIDSGMQDYHTSETKHDAFAIDKLRSWLDAPTFD